MSEGIMHVYNTPAKTFGMGLATFVGVPIVTGVLLITVIGSGIALGVAITYLWFVFGSFILQTGLVGHILYNWFTDGSDKPLVSWKSLIIGYIALVVLGLLIFVPVIGPFVAIAVLIISILLNAFAMGGLMRSFSQLLSSISRSKRSEEHSQSSQNAAPKAEHVSSQTEPSQQQMAEANQNE